MSVSTHYVPETRIQRSVQDHTWVRHGKVLTELALPFISLYKPANTPLAYGLGLLGITQGTVGLIQSGKRLQSAAVIAKGVADLATAYFQYRALLIANGMLDLVQAVHQLHQAPLREKASQLIKCLSIGCYLLAQVYQSTLQWMILSLAFQASLNFYQAYQAYLAEQKPEDVFYEKTLTVMAKIVMGFIRLNQTYRLYEFMKSFEAAAKTHDEDLIHGEAVEDDLNKPASTIEEDSDHPLKNLSQKIKDNRVVLIDPTTGKKYDFGAYFHGYGKGLVEGANLRFQQEEEYGTFVTKLAFKVNRFYLSGKKLKFETFQLSSDQIKTLGVTHNLGYRSTPLGYRNKEGIVIHTKEILASESFIEEIFPINIQGVGSIILRQAHVTVSLVGDKGIGDFQRFLALFGLEEALQPSSSEDLEKMKLQFFFSFFFPQEAIKFQKEESILSLPIEEMKQKMISAAPALENYLQEYQPQPIEILPGYHHYSIPVDGKAYDMGGRALTAMLVPSNKWNEYRYNTEISSLDLNKKELSKIANIVRHGMFSENMRGISQMNLNGIGGDGNVFTQMVWKHEMESQKNLEELGYSEAGSVRLYFSLEALNRGSYQDRGEGYPIAYKDSNIIEYISSFPIGHKGAMETHEVRIPDRTLPNELKGMSVPTERMRDQILSHLREVQLIQVDAQGQETIHGIPAKEFVSTNHHIPVDIIQRCGKSEE